MKRVLFFEGFKHKPYFTDNKEKISYKALSKKLIVFLKVNLFIIIKITSAYCRNIVN